MYSPAAAAAYIICFFFFLKFHIFLSFGAQMDRFQIYYICKQSDITFEKWVPAQDSGYWQVSKIR